LRQARFPGDQGGAGAPSFTARAQRLAAIAQSFGDVDPGNVLLAVKIGKGAGDTQRAVIAAGAQRERVGCIAQQREPSGLWRRDLLEHRPVALGIGADACWRRAA
jgi:hypothetical protein